MVRTTKAARNHSCLDAIRQQHAQEWYMGPFCKVQLQFTKAAPPVVMVILEALLDREFQILLPS